MNNQEIEKYSKHFQKMSFSIKILAHGKRDVIWARIQVEQLGLIICILQSLL